MKYLQLLSRHVSQHFNVRYMKSSPRTFQKIVDDVIQKNVRLIGWSLSVRRQKNRTFIHLLDGSACKPLQIVVETSLCPDGVTQGSCLEVHGALVASKSRMQNVELRAENVHLLGTCPGDYPLGGPGNLEAGLARGSALHVRHRTLPWTALLRLRALMKTAFRDCLTKEGFLEVDTPLLTSADCEGAGETLSLDGRTGRECFGETPVHLTVSGQLHLEVAASGLGQVYTLSPTFRADKSRTRHHLAEFLMLEVESVYWRSTQDLCDAIEHTLRSAVLRVRDTCCDDLEVIWSKIPLSKTSEEGSSPAQNLECLLSKPFVRMTFGEARELLVDYRDELTSPVDSQLCDLSKEQEHFLTQYSGNVPVFVTDFPSQSKPFYCMENEEDSAMIETTVASVDLLLPRVGEVVGGSVREHRLDLLQNRMMCAGIDPDTMSWYLDLRRWGGAPHAGYGLGFDRLLQWITGIHNIRDVVLFPRYYGSCVL